MHHKAPRHAVRRAASRLALAGLITASLTALALVSGGTSASASVQKAVSTTTNINSTVGGNGNCAHGQLGVDANNCNLYDAKEDVWLSGLPASADLLDGTYFFAILEPGGQPDPNDGGAKNLSDDFDAVSDRTFTMSGGQITSPAGHLFDDLGPDANKLQASPFADTGNPGGVYILAVCRIPDGGGDVAAKDCKYDAFKVKQQTPPPNAQPLVVTKDADGTYDLAYTWGIDKSVDQTTVVQTAQATWTFNYTVVVDRSEPTTSGVSVSGTITVFNPNSAPVHGVDVTDQLSEGATCTVTGGEDATVPPGETEFAYTCVLTDTDSVPVGLDNTATATWPADGSHPDGALAAGSDSFIFEDIDFEPPTQTDECVLVEDLFDSSDWLDADLLDDELCGDDSFTYPRQVVVPRDACATYDNTARFTTNDSGTQGIDDASVTVCGPVTGGHTMGFWQNKNGQAIIKTGAIVAGNCAAAEWLNDFGPFAAAPLNSPNSTKECDPLAAYVLGIIKTASASGASMNAMLKAQMLATALSVYYGSPEGGSKIPNGPLGPKVIDLTHICKNPLACTLTQDVSNAFGGATSMSVIDMLVHAGSAPQYVADNNWYAQVKTEQEKAKNAFDAINNNVAFATP